MANANLLRDGHPTTISFGDYPSIVLEEKKLSPPGLMGGGRNDQTTMRNTTVRTARPKALKETTPATGTFAYGAVALTDLIAMVNHLQLITVTFHTGAIWSNWGWLDEFKPNEHEEGVQPTAVCTIQFGNQNEDGDEVVPALS